MTTNRIELIKRLHKLSFKDLEKITGTKSRRWQNIFANQAKLYEEDLQGIYNKYPQYIYWLATGKERPEYGDISPMTEITNKNLQETKKAGN